LAAAVLEEAVRRLGGSFEEKGGEAWLVFNERGFSLADLPAEALRELLGYRLVVIVEKGFGEEGTDYYYYVRRWEVERLISVGEGGAARD